MKYDAVIIGCGVGGLECAHILSRAGMSVLLLEREAQAGGCIQSYKRQGLTYDTGFHYVGGLAEGQSLYAAFKRLGLLRLPWHRLDEVFDRVMIGDRTFSFAQGYEAFVDTLAADFPAERGSLNRYVDVLRQGGNWYPFNFLDARSGDVPLAFDLFERSAYQYLEETFQDPLLIQVLSGTSLKMELRRESLPLFTFVHGNRDFIESSWRLKGDGSLIVNALMEDIRAYGGEVILNAEVQELVEKDGRLTHVVCSNGEVYEGDRFISDVHPALTCGWVKRSDRMKKTYRNRITSLENTFGICTVSLAIKPKSIKYFNWNQYIYKRPNVWTFYQEDEAVSGLLVSARVPEDGSEYVRQIDMLTPMTWDKCAAWSDTKVGHRGDAYRVMKERVADECVALAERFIPNLRDKIDKRYVSTPLTYRDYTCTPQGSAYGLRKDFRNPLMTILSSRTPIPNLFLTGQNLVLHGLQGVTVTAFLTCSEILGKEYIENIMKDE